MSAFGKLLCLGTAIAAASLVLPGCAENESSMFVIGVMALEDTDCVLDPNPANAFLPVGVLDQALRSSYIAPLLVGNQLTERGSRNQLRTETSRIRLEGVEVTLEDIGGNELTSFTSLGAGFANPAAGTDPSYGGMIAEVIPQGSGLPDGQYVAAIKAFGTTLGGEEIDSAELRFPIQVCTGCLISYPGAAMDRNAPAGSDFVCAQSTADALDEKNALGQMGCFPGQDRFVSCVYCAAVSDVCLSPANNPYYAGG